MQNTPAGQIFESLFRYRKWWLIPTMVCTVAAIGYALFTEKSYTSRQTLVIRDDLVGTFFKPGRFDSLDSMKSAQETILEISRRPQVVRSALEQLGAPAMQSENAWLGDANIEKMQGKIQISAPNGAEFGRTEAIVLSVSQNTRERSRDFVNFLLDEIEESLRNLRSRQYQSMNQELKQAANLAAESYVDAATRLKEFEKNVGVDLSSLISLNDSQAGTNNLQSELGNLSFEQRKAWSELEEVKKQIEILNDVAGSPEALMEVPQELLKLQPTLLRLATGLNDAILNYAKTKGRYQVSHPRVREDAREVEDIKQRIKDKLVRTLGSLNYQLELRQSNYQKISKLIDDKKLRLSELSSMRVDYATLKAEVDKKREINGKAQANKAEIESLGGAVGKVNLISRIDEPQTDLYPSGPSNKIIVFGGMTAGLFIGLGLVMFITPLDGPRLRSNVADEVNHAAEPFELASDVESKPPATKTTDQLEFREVSEPDRKPERKPDLAKPSSRSITDLIKSAPAPSTAEKNVEPERSDTRNEESKPATIKPIQSPFVADSLKAIDKSEQKLAPKTGEPKGSELSEPASDVDVKKENRDVQLAESKMFEDALNSISEERAESSLKFFESKTTPPPVATPQPVASVKVPQVANVGQQDTQMTGSPETSTSLPESNEVAKKIEEQSSVGLNPELHDTEELVTEDLKALQESNFPIATPSSETQKTKEVAVLQPTASSLSDASGIKSLENIKDTTPLPSLIGPVQTGEPVSMDDMNEYDELDDDELDAALDIFAEEPELTEEDLAKLRVGQTGGPGLVEKVNQLEQSEIILTDEIDNPLPSITETGSLIESPLTVSPPTVETESTGLPLMTSTQNSPDFQKVGHESDPNPGANKPENRPAATTVDLRMLKDQLSGKNQTASSRDEKLPPKLEDSISRNPVETNDSSSIDQSLSDLANSIRDVCKKTDDV